VSDAGEYRGVVKRIALIGGIGSGKSTLEAHLVGRGLPVIDADAIARRLTVPGAPVGDAIVDAFGAGVLREGVIDRALLASVAFARPENLTRLNALTHPAIGREMRREMDEQQAPAVFVAIPLFREDHRRSLALDEVWGVVVAPTVALDRLVHQRGMTLDDARARLEAQPSNAEREALCDLVLANDGTPEDLFARVDGLLAERGIS